MIKIKWENIQVNLHVSFPVVAKLSVIINTKETSNCICVKCLRYCSVCFSNRATSEHSATLLKFIYILRAAPKRFFVAKYSRAKRAPAEHHG